MMLLASDGSTSMTGEIVDTDGGQTSFKLTGILSHPALYDP